MEEKDLIQGLAEASKNSLAIKMANSDKVFGDYEAFWKKQDEDDAENTKRVMAEIRPKTNYPKFQAIKKWLSDEENGIYSYLKIVQKPKGNYELQYDPEYTFEGDYWKYLKGMWIDQSCGMSGDDYHGTLAIHISGEDYLEASFSL